MGQAAGTDRDGEVGSFLLQEDDAQVNEPVPARIAYLNDPVQNGQFGYPSNHVRTHKYTLFTFLPKNLFEQFRRLANLYFLAIMIIMFIPTVAPFLPITSILPLMFVIGISAVKDGYEDYWRYKEDKLVNTRSIEVVRGGAIELVLCEDVCVGDIVRVGRGHEFPADLLLLASSDERGVCYVETSNLDGESNLKDKACVGVGAQCRTPADLSALSARVEYENPVIDLYAFHGRIVTPPHAAGNRQSDSVPLGEENLLLRGASLGNTEWVYGMALYTGVETKLVLNSQEPPSKFSNVEHRLNRYILYIFCFLLAICVFSAVMHMTWKLRNGNEHWYLSESGTISENMLTAVLITLTMLVLYNMVIPISLIVSCEMIRIVGAYWVGVDRDMFCTDTKKFAEVRTSNLLEELGQVSFAFCDKTGTLTCNRMTFQQCGVAGKTYFVQGTAAAAAHAGAPTIQEHVSERDVRRVLECMALCHTVTLNDSTGAYEASSPDEEALVTGAAACGVKLTARETAPGADGEPADTLVLATPDGEQRFRVLEVLPFTHERKRMSVLVETADGRAVLFCKGADSVVLRRVACAVDEREEMVRLVDAYAAEGLRTLCMACKELADYSGWRARLGDAKVRLEGREEALAALYEELERDMTLLGCTAVEDELQADVPETLRDLTRAGVHVWMLTGDKTETAVNIAHSCHLLAPGMEVKTVTATSAIHCENLLKEHASVCLDDESEAIISYALVIDGRSLGYALELFPDLLVPLCVGADTVVAARVYPMQKALMVRMVKETPPFPITLAIGDGANDVGMIQEAHVGVGIQGGREGQQAVLSSDYAISQFRFLKRLLLVHGRFSYIRVSVLILYSLYKNMTLTLPLLFYSFVCAFSGQTFMDGVLMMLYNIIYTSWPVLILGTFEKDVPDDVLMAKPEMYRRMQRNEEFNERKVFQWFGSSVWHAIVVFYGTIAMFENDIFVHTGITYGLTAMSAMAMTLCFVVVTLKIGLETRHWTWLNHVTVWGSIVIYFSMLFPLSMLDNAYPEFYGVANVLLSNVYVWAILVVMTVAALLPDYALKFIYTTLYPTDVDIVREQRHQRRKHGDDSAALLDDTL